MLLRFLNKIKRWFYTKQFILEEEPFLHTLSHRSVKEDTRDAQTRKRVAKAFEQQEVQMRARAMKAHDASCIDPWTCEKSVCFKFEPDKIVSQEEVSGVRKRFKYTEVGNRTKPKSNQD